MPPLITHFVFAGSKGSESSFLDTASGASIKISKQNVLDHFIYSLFYKF